MTDLLHNLRAMRAHAAQRDWRTLDEAIAEIERNSTDATRYRWLRAWDEHHKSSSPIIPMTGMYGSEALLRGALDAAIDHALAAERRE
jgi:hypothetical protein